MEDKTKAQNLKKKLSDLIFAGFITLLTELPFACPHYLLYRAYSSGYISAYNKKIRQCEETQNPIKCRRDFAYYVLNLSKNKNLEQNIEAIREYEIK